MVVYVFLEPPRIQPSAIPTVRIDPEGMTDQPESRRVSMEREQAERRKTSTKDHAKEQAKAKPKPQVNQIKLLALTGEPKIYLIFFLRLDIKAIKSLFFLDKAIYCGFSQS